MPTEREIGVVYILVNDSMPGLVKIGYTLDTAEARAKELSGHSGVPVPFRVVWTTEKIPEPRVVEQKVHERISSLRASAGREFFRIDSESAIVVIKEFAGEAHRIAVEKRRHGMQERAAIKKERINQYLRRSISQKYTEEHRRFFALQQIREEDKKTSTLIYVLFGAAVPLAYLNKLFDVNWYHVVLPAVGLWLWLFRGTSSFPEPEVNMNGDSIAFTCFRCRNREEISTDFPTQKLRVQHFCSGCGQQLV